MYVCMCIQEVVHVLQWQVVYGRGLYLFAVRGLTPLVIILMTDIEKCLANLPVHKRLYPSLQSVCSNCFTQLA